ncbi:amidase family protein [Micromonospora sp. NPDC049662]|uniref:amidase family protein n=1 Tax=Micromonospora sp. NPDC049662 TaxID=3155397 RepID=UPI00343C195B
MADDEIHWWSAHAVADAIRQRRISAREYLDVLLRRIERLNPGLGLVVTLDDRAHQYAAAADQATMRGEASGRLHGVAMTVKDSLATAGVRTTAGTEDLACYVPDRDAQTVAMLRAAGAIIIGKTNMPAYAADVQTDSPLHGTARNPWRPDHTTGGSSGGAAGAVAAGLSPLEMGSDVAGSIRIPAAYCGVAGHKPSFGVVSLDGHAPPYPRKYTPPDMAVIGPLARTVDDLALALDVVAGPGPDERSAWRLDLPPARTVRRVAVWADDPYCPVDDEVRAAVTLTADLLTTSGIRVETAAPTGFNLAESDEVFRRLLVCVASGDYTPAELDGIAAGRLSPRADLGAEFYPQRHREWMIASERRTQMRRRWREFFDQYDALLLPVTPNVVPSHDDRPFSARRITVNGAVRSYWDQIVWAGLTGVSYLPTTVVPVGFDSRGLPVGIAVAGPYLEDRTSLELARRIAELLPVAAHPPVG